MMFYAKNYSHTLLKQWIRPGDYVVDATVGNGYDTLLCAELVGPKGHVYGCDIAPKAIANTYHLLRKHQLDQRCSLYLKGHETLDEVLDASVMIRVALFNLGYLPGSSKDQTTHEHTTWQAVHTLLPHLLPEGLIILVLYPGHKEGAQERSALLKYAQSLSYHDYYVTHQAPVNQPKSPPELLLIYKRAKNIKIKNA